MQKGFAPIIILVGIFLLASVGGAYYLFKVKTPIQRACTMDAKICPDGSSVGRTGPNCEFAPCLKSFPSPSPDETANKNYVCPQGWINCMPSTGSGEGAEVRKACSKEFLDWAKANCPNFKGVAY